MPPSERSQVWLSERDEHRRRGRVHSLAPLLFDWSIGLGCYGRPRATHDVDLLTLTDNATSHAYLMALRAKGFAVASN